MFGHSHGLLHAVPQGGFVSSEGISRFPNLQCWRSFHSGCVLLRSPRAVLWLHQPVDR